MYSNAAIKLYAQYACLSLKRLVEINRQPFFYSSMQRTFAVAFVPIGALLLELPLALMSAPREKTKQNKNIPTFGRDSLQGVN